LLTMQVALFLVFFLFLVHGNLGSENEKEAQFKSQNKMTIEELEDRNIREAGKVKKNKKEKRPRKNSGSIIRKRNKNKIKHGIKKISERKNQKGNKKSNKDKKGPKSTKGKRRKLKITKKKKKGSKNKKVPGSSRQQTCSSTIQPDCFIAAKDALVFEGNQVSNFFKKFTRYKNHNKTTGNKLGKKGNFEAPKLNMEESMGGNVSSTSMAKCNNDASRGNFSTTYDMLSNCSAMIAEKCAVTPPESSMMEGMEKCNTEMKAFKTATKNCMENFKTDATLQCTCWESAKLSVENIKKLSPKCIQNIDSMAKKMKNDKKACIDAFIKCKKAEDASVRLINDCMNFDVQSLNQSKIAEEAGSKITG